MSTQQQTPQWRGNPQVMQHCFWSEFRGGLGDIGLITKFRGSGDGFKPENFGPFELEGWIYSVAQKTSQKGSTYYDVERRPKGAGSNPAGGEDGWKKGHEENVKMHQESMKITQALIDAINENTRQQKENSIILDQIRMHTETLAADSTKKNAFADGTGKKVESK